MATVENIEAPANGDGAHARANPHELAAVQAILARISRHPVETVAALLRGQREADERCQATAGAAEQLRQMLEDLLQPPHTLGYLERLRIEDGGVLRAVVRINGQLRELAIHPEVDVAALEQLMPWDHVLVNPKELVVTGLRSEPALKHACAGDVVEFKNYQDRELGLAIVSRHGHGEEVVALASTLRETPLTTGTMLVLHRDNPRWAIDSTPTERAETRYEVPINKITTRLDDLAGVESVVEPLLEDLLLRVVYSQHRRRFRLKPLNGLILYSHKAGMGKTALIRAMARFLYDLGQKSDFDVILNSVKPNEFKSSWHGEDAANVRRFAAGLRARLTQPRSRRLIVLNVFDECDSLGSRHYRSEQLLSAAQNDCVQALLAEMDGLVQLNTGASDAPPVDIVWIGLTNAPDGIDLALKRPGRFGDLVLQMPDYTCEAAESILAIYARGADVPWFIDDEIRFGPPEEELRQRIIQPALRRVYGATVLRYGTEGQRRVEVTAGQILAGVHYESAMNRAKRRAAVRSLRGSGVPAIGGDDLLAALLDESRSAAAQLAADQQMLVRTLQIKVPVVHPEVVSEGELRQQQFVRI